jgi:hypothetical protein
MYDGWRRERVERGNFQENEEESSRRRGELSNSKVLVWLE